ncbi:MAG TPA: serine hydrolase [Steroidobacteraceae bacterium]|nr:serine hydrolase [Steroidobacteraceae bacterium]
MKRSLCMLLRAGVSCVALACATSAQAAAAVPAASIDALFAEWTRATPGCAVGVSDSGRVVLEKAYGMADLEHDVPNRPNTIFEAGSVSKQFTAAAVLLLARDGKLSLDDPVRRYIPELPAYAAPVTIRQMLHHTSGLRDWGSVAWIAGVPRGSRAYTHAHVLDILMKQETLNFPPGTRWSYSNSGYNLSAILVSRVAGEPFAEFTRKRLFEPLGMTRTSWRDDYTRIVIDRAVAYAESDGRYAQDMPFENVHGNGGLLTTVGDLLRWNANFESPKVGDDAWVRLMHTSGALDSGKETSYAYGLGVGRYKGLEEVRHSGTTGSYRAYLARFPEQRVSVAVLCNAGNSMPGQALHAVADLYLANALEPDPPPSPAKVPSSELDARTGLYREVERGVTARITREGDTLKVNGDTTLVPQSAQRFTGNDGVTVEFDDEGRAHVDVGDGWTETYEPVEPARPKPAELESLAGRYSSREAETTFIARVAEGRLELTQRPDTVYRLDPLYADAFESEIGTIIFRRDAANRAVALSVVQDRVWDLRFRNEAAPKKRVLAYGDSNTWGWIPVEQGFPTSRFGAGERWTGIAQAALGDGYEIIEEGLSGRTTDLPDPSVSQIAGAGLDGSAYLPAAVASHLPLDLVVIMLGTNDLKALFDRTPADIAGGMRTLVESVKKMGRAAWTEYPAPKILVVAPPPLATTERFPAAVFDDGIGKSRQLAARYAKIAQEAGVHFLDASAVTGADGVDGIHLTATAHRQLGLAIAAKVKECLP